MAEKMAERDRAIRDETLASIPDPAQVDVAEVRRHLMEQLFIRTKTGGLCTYKYDAEYSALDHDEYERLIRNGEL